MSSDDAIITLRIDYANAKLKAAQAAQSELEARYALLRIVESKFSNGIQEGTQTYQCNDGVKIKITQPYSYKISVDNTELEAALDHLPEHIENNLVKYKPSLSVTEYRRLNESHKRIIDECIEIVPGKPQIKID